MCVARHVRRGLAHLEDELGCFFGHRLNVDATLGRADQDRPAGRTVHQDGKVGLSGNV
jgi:hypothetical protein